MFVVRSNRRYNTLLSYKRSELFRFDKAVLNSNPGHSVFLSTFNNSYQKFRVISFPVRNGNYIVKVTTLDSYQNENTGIQGTVAIGFSPLAPVNVRVSLSGNNVTLTWSTSADGNPDNYIIYGNGGAGSTSIVRTVLYTIAGSLNTYTFAVANGNWSFVVESKKSGVESVTMNKVSVMVPVTATIPPKAGVSSNTNPNGSVQPTGLMLANASVGKVNIQFLWLYGNQADTFNVYHDSGTGVIDYSSPKFTFARQNQLIQYYTTSQLIFVDGPTTYLFVVRASLAGVEEKNTDSYNISVDGLAPPNPQSLVLDSVF